MFGGRCTNKEEGWRKGSARGTERMRGQQHRHMQITSSSPITTHVTRCTHCVKKPIQLRGTQTNGVCTVSVELYSRCSTLIVLTILRTSHPCRLIVEPIELSLIIKVLRKTHNVDSYNYMKIGQSIDDDCVMTPNTNYFTTRVSVG